MARTQGIDISKWQGDIEWGKIPLYIRFGIAKASQYNWADPKFLSNWSELREHGFIRGAYHLLHLTESIQEQVDFYLSLVPFEKGDLPPFLDVETSKIEDVKDPAKAHAGILEWLRTVEQRIGGKPILYISPRGVRKLEGHTEGLNEYLLWDVQYVDPFPPPPDQEPTLPETFSTWTFWQYTSSGPGKDWGMESTGLDLDYFNGNENQLLELANSIPWEQKNMLTPEQVASAIQFNANQGFSLREVSRIYDVVRVQNPWDMSHVMNQIAIWQGFMGLVADGKVGDKTVEKMSSLL